MGQAKRRAKEILELKKYQEYMRINFDCSEWFYVDGSVMGTVNIKNSNLSFNYCLEVEDWRSRDYYFVNTLDIYNIDDEIEEITEVEYKLNDEVNLFLQNLFNKNDFLKELKEDLMKTLPIKDFENEIEDSLEKYNVNYSDEEIEMFNKLDEVKPLVNLVICDGCDGSGYHYLVTLEEYKENPKIELGGDIRCYKCGGDGEHEKGFEGLVAGGKIYVPYKK